MTKKFEINSPYVVMFESEDGVTCHLYPPKGFTYEHYGLLVCDLVRHVARAFNVSEEDVWRWVDKERYNPTTDVRRAQ